MCAYHYPSAYGDPSEPIVHSKDPILCFSAMDSISSSSTQFSFSPSHHRKGSFENSSESMIEELL